MGDDAAANACPVDHKARAAWLDAAQQQNDAQQQQQQHQRSLPHPATQSTASSSPLPASCNSSTMDQKPRPSPAAAYLMPKGAEASLSTARQISSIPRAPTTVSSSPSIPASTIPANAESDTPADAASGNWIYPSEEMFFNAMRRKQYDPKAADMRAVIPIHNAVNERAWKEIKEWEAGKGSEDCGGPKLVSFSGDSRKLTPRARWRSMMGYTPPFDRHDWVVDRCGVKVEYVIDFYKGKEGGGKVDGLSFYLDVRPKLNSFEGWRMRAMRLAGW